MNSLFFDLDDTLINTNKSKEITFEYLLSKISNDINFDTLKELKSNYQYYDYIDIYKLFLYKKFGIEIDKEKIIEEFNEFYFKNARRIESIYIDFEVLQRLRKKYKLFIVSNRPRNLYNPIWANDLNPYFDHVVCKGDYNDLEDNTKLSLLRRTMFQFRIDGGSYIGNEVSDMKIAKECKLSAIGVSTTESKEKLKKAGADMVIKNINEIEKLYL